MRLLRFIISLALLLSMAVTAFAGTVMYIKSPNSYPVNFREEPDRRSLILSRLITGTAVEVFESTGEWTHIYVEGKDGYVLTEYISYLDPLSEVKPPEKKQETVTEEETWYIISPNSGTVNFREEANRHSKIIDRLVTGTVITILEHGEEWTKIEHNGKEGYVLSIYITKDNPYHIDPVEKRMYYIQSDDSYPVNFRDAPNGELVTRLLTGTIVEVLEEEVPEGWTKIAFGDLTGYVMSKYIIARLPEMIDRSYEAHVETTDGNGVRVRYGAGKGYDIVTFIPDGTELTVLGSVQGYARIRCGSIEGFIEEIYLVAD